MVYVVAVSAAVCTFFLNTDCTQGKELSPDRQEIYAHRLPLNLPSLPLCLEDLTDSDESICSLSGKNNIAVDFYSVEKFQSNFTKVSFKYLFALQPIPGGEHRFLDLRKLLI